VERKQAIIFPQYLRNILKLRGYDSASTVTAITKEDIETNFEKFAKTDMKQYIGQNNKNDYYSIFGTPEKFQIIPGHKILLHKVVQFVTEMTNHYGIDYFNFYLSPTTTGSRPICKRGKLGILYCYSSYLALKFQSALLILWKTIKVKRGKMRNILSLKERSKTCIRKSKLHFKTLNLLWKL